MSNVNIKVFTINIAMKKGKKEGNEKSFKNFYKQQCKTSLKRPAKSFSSLLVSVSPSFYLTRYGANRKSPISIPSVLKPKSRVFYGFKIIVAPKVQSNLGLTYLLNLQITDFSRKKINNDSEKFKSSRLAFEHKAFAHFRWFK